MEDPLTVRLFLFVVEGAPRTSEAIDNLRRALAAFDARTFQLEIVDVFEAPERAIADRVLVTPTLIAQGTAPRLVGDLSETSMLNYFLQRLA
jgi:circadian clock protein KaiB